MDIEVFHSNCISSLGFLNSVLRPSGDIERLNGFVACLQGVENRALLRVYNRIFNALFQEKAPSTAHSLSSIFSKNIFEVYSDIADTGLVLQAKTPLICLVSPLSSNEKLDYSLMASQPFECLYLSTFYLAHLWFLFFVYRLNEDLPVYTASMSLRLLSEEAGKVLAKNEKNLDFFSVFGETNFVREVIDPFEFFDTDIALTLENALCLVDKSSEYYYAVATLFGAVRPKITRFLAEVLRSKGDFLAKKKRQNRQKFSHFSVYVISTNLLGSPLNRGFLIFLISLFKEAITSDIFEINRGNPPKFSSISALNCLMALSPSIDLSKTIEGIFVDVLGIEAGKEASIEGKLKGFFALVAGHGRFSHKGHLQILEFIRRK